MRTNQHLIEPFEPPRASDVSRTFFHMQPVLIGVEELRELGITYSKEHLRRLEATEQFPKRVRLTPSRVVWMFNEVMAWINDRADERRFAA